MDNNVLNTFSRGMNLDSVPSMQPDGTYRVLVNGQHESYDFNSFGIVNEPSNELCFSLPEGYDICGWGFIEERDQFVIFSKNEKTKVSQIGIGDTKKCEYKIILEDKDPEKFLNKLCFSQSEKIVPQFKNLRPCNDLWIYWSNDFTYYRLNLDADLCDINYDDLILFDCKCPSVIEASHIEDGGELLEVGSYQFACQLVDEDENFTNWFSISNPINLTSANNRLGDKSTQAILLTISKLPKSYPKVAIAVIKTVGGVQTATVFAVLYHNGKNISYIYRGKDKDDEPIEIKELITKKTGFIRGRDLVQRDGRLFLYNLMEEWNIDAQKYANRIKASFIVGKMPAMYAGDTPTLPRGEVISLAAVYNYCDGTSSLGFHIQGRKGSKDDFTIIPTSDPRNCTSCDKYKWEIENTAFIEEDYCANSYALKSSLSNEIVLDHFNPEVVIYSKISREDFVFCKVGDQEVVDQDKLECLDAIDVGADCDECQEKFLLAADIVVGKVSCPDDEECVDGYCPTTGKPCKFCSTCGGTDYFIEQKIGSFYDTPDTHTVGALDFDDCPNGEVVYDEAGCRVIGYKPAKVAKGKFGYWQSTELYPKAKGCDGEYLYEELAGTPIRHHLVPDESLVKFAVSKTNGVVGNNNIDNYEWLNTDVFPIGLELCNIELPPNPPKPYCQNNPVSIYWQKIDPIDRRVNARGLMTHTFLGNIRNKEYAVPKNAVNSMEYYDRHIDNGKQYEDETGRTLRNYRGGKNINLPIYNFHSPETHFEKIPLTADRVYFTNEVFGVGERYGIWAAGEEPINMWHTTTNERGTRQNINLNKSAITGDPIGVANPGRCNDQITVEFTLDVCRTQPKGKFRLCVSPQVFPATRVTKLTVTEQFRGITNTVYNGNQLCLIGEEDNPHVQTDVEFSFTIKDGTNLCTYSGLVEMDARRDAQPGCLTIKNITYGSPDAHPPTYKYSNGAHRCVKAKSYADSDSIVDKGDKFTYSLLNLKREDSVYLELSGKTVSLTNGIDQYLSDGKYNGLGSPVDGTSDGSFLGDVRCENCPILNNAGHHAILINDSPNQYGRIESATYIPLGMNLSATDVICGRIEKFGIGDSYIGLHSFRRYSFVSDKVGKLDDQIPPMIDRFGKRILRRDFYVFVDNLLCRHDCSKIPPTCDGFTYDDRGVAYPDNRKRINLRGPENGFVETCWDKEPFVGYVGKDTYHGHTVNSVVSFWTESRINLWKLKNGEVDYYHFELDKNYPTSKGAETYYKKIATNGSKLALDSSIPEDTPWNYAWLNRIGIKWRTIALLKRITIAVVKLLIILGITTIIAIALGGGIVGGVLAALIFGWLIFNDAVNLRICQWLYSLFSVKQCRPKCLGNRENCYIVDEDTLPFDKNYYGYNWDFNVQNDLETKIGMTDPYNTCICEVGEGNQIVYSQKQNPLSITDSYKNFLVNSYLNIPADFGKLKSLYSLNNNFYAQTSDMIINIATSDGFLNLGNGQLLEVLTEGGDLRTRPKELFSDMPEGYAGTSDPNSAINTQYGRFFVDRKAKKIFLFGKGIKEISNFGIRNFLKENLELELFKQFPDYKNVDEVAGIGYRLGFDHRFNKLLFTKVDYKAKHPEELSVYLGSAFQHKSGVMVKLDDPTYFEDRSFTLSYDPEQHTWISFHTYFPDGYAYDRDHMYTIKDGGFWKHGDKYGDFQMFYGKYHPHTVEFVIKQKDLSYNFFKDMELETEASEFDGVGWINGKEKTFTDAMFSNDRHNSGKVAIVDKSNNNALSNIKQNDEEVMLSWDRDSARINAIKNRVIEKDTAMFDKRGNDGLQILNEQIIGNSTGRLEGKYLVARLILDRPESSNLQHLTKRINTTQDKPAK